jgi:hypothetical protein
MRDNRVGIQAVFGEHNRVFGCALTDKKPSEETIRTETGLKMHRLQVCLSGTGLVLLGYLLGTSGGLTSQLLLAEAEKPAAAESSSQENSPEVKPQEEEAPGDTSKQPPKGPGPSEATLQKIRQAYEALAEAADALEKEGYYRAATKEVNVFGVLSGGVDALSDLQSGNGVDPETFAAIYAGTVKPEIQEYLQRDSSNHYTYNGKLIQMYPISELRRRFVFRARLTGQTQPAGQNEAATSPQSSDPSGAKTEQEPEKKTSPQ